MRKFTKICLIICSILAALGIILAIVGMVLGFSFGDFKSLVKNGSFQIGYWENNWQEDLESLVEEVEKSDEEWYNDNKTFSAAQVEKLDIQFQYGKVIIEPTSDEDIEVSVEYRSKWENYSRNVEWTLNGTTLKVRDDVDKKIARLVSNGADDAILTIKIPQNKQFKEVDLDIGAALVSLEGTLSADVLEIAIGAGEFTVESDSLLAAQKVSLEVGAGSMICSGIQTKELDAECGIGQMTLEQVDAEEIDAECGIGQIDMFVTGQERDYNYVIECGIGQVNIGGIHYTGLDREQEIQNNANRTMNIDCGIGEIEVVFQQ